MFAAFNEELFKEITQLLTLENFRYDKKLLFSGCFLVLDSCVGYVCIFRLIYCNGNRQCIGIMNSYPNTEIRSPLGVLCLQNSKS